MSDCACAWDCSGHWAKGSHYAPAPEAPAEDAAATIAHALTCTRCRQGWTCGGPGIEDSEQAEWIRGLLAAHDDAVRAEALREVTLAWQCKGWADVMLTSTNPIANGQAVTDWLRAREDGNR